VNAHLPHPLSIAVADSAALGHVNTGLDQYRRFAHLAHNRGTLDNVDFFTNALQCGVPAITNLALGLELLIKVHHFQISGQYPRGHDIAILGTSFSAPQMDTMRANYARWQNNPGVDKGLEFRVSGGGPERQDRAWVQPNFDTYDLAIAYIGPAYVRWRYIYEEFQSDLNIVFSFAPLYFSAMSVHEAIRSYHGDVRSNAT
jgi:hypothetical protein